MCKYPIWLLGNQELRVEGVLLTGPQALMFFSAFMDSSRLSFFLRLDMSYLLHEYLMTGLERGLNMIRTLATLQKDAVLILHGNP